MNKDTYLYSNGVLINNFGIKEKNELKAVETALTSASMKTIVSGGIEGNYDFKHYCEFNKRIFGKIYEWAGQPRTVNIEKAEPLLKGLSVEYADAGNIENSLKRMLKEMNEVDWDCLWLDKKAEQLAIYMGDLWKIHAFREGNTRTMVLFCSQFAKEHGFPLDTEIFRNYSKHLRDALVAISAKFSDGTDVSQSAPLIGIVKASMETGKKQMSLDGIKKEIMEIRRAQPQESTEPNHVFPQKTKNKPKGKGE
jgi:cell filamentation protein